ncbi:MAG: hypothetical protein JWL59_4241 [Chthoniobacteraceae bacterium]|nr:hypothetical protein [Chthoniobacteraceae bacterium]
MNPIRPITVAALCICAIAITSLYLLHDSSGSEQEVHFLKMQLAERERVIAELRDRQAYNAAAFPRENPAGRQEVDINSTVAPDVGIAAAQQRLETMIQRMEERMAQLERHLKQARLIPFTRAEHEAELLSATETLMRVRDRLQSENEEARRLSIALGVPEMLTKLPPHEALNDPRYQRYRAYFAARISAGYTQSLVSASEDAIARFVVESPPSQ